MMVRLALYCEMFRCVLTRLWCLGGGRIQGYNVYMATSDVGDFTEVATTIGTDTMDVVEVLHLSESSDEPLLPETRYIFKAVAVTLVDICISVATSLQLANATDTYTAAAAIPGPPRARTSCKPRAE